MWLVLVPLCSFAACESTPAVASAADALSARGQRLVIISACALASLRILARWVLICQQMQYESQQSANTSANGQSEMFCRDAETEKVLIDGGRANVETNRILGLNNVLTSALRGMMLYGKERDRHVAR